MLVEQHPQHPVRRDQPEELPVGVDHCLAAFVALHHFPGGALLVGIGRDRRRVGVHDVRDAGVRVGGQKPLDRNQPDEPPRLEHDHILSAPKLAPYKLRPDLADALVAPSHRDTPGRVLRRDAQQSVRLDTSGDYSKAATILYVERPSVARLRGYIHTVCSCRLRATG